jgi:RNA-directed DNA polymerase
MNQKSSMNVGGESDGCEVPAKSLNKDGRSSAEGSEGRRPTKENIEQTTTSRTQSWGEVLSGLRDVRERARGDKRLQFTALLHHVSIPLLEGSFYALKREAAPGVDGMTWKEYETNSEGAASICNYFTSPPRVSRQEPAVGTACRSGSR